MQNEEVEKTVNRCTAAQQLHFRPLVLKRLILDCGLNQAEIGKAANAHRSTMNVAVNRGFLPNIPHFRENVEAYLSEIPAATAWLKERGITVADIWQVDGESLFKQTPKGARQRTVDAWKGGVLSAGDPGTFKETVEEAMLSLKAKKHFKIGFMNPFKNKLLSPEEVFLSEDHLYIQEAFIEAAKHNGALAIIGEVGSGKSTIRVKAIDTLSRSYPKVKIIYPAVKDKRKINESTLNDLLIRELSNRTLRPRRSNEDKADQADQLLIDHAKSGGSTCLVIDEAHDFIRNPDVMRILKRFYEIEYKGRNVMGIVLIGQVELEELFDERIYPGIREAIRRFEIARIAGLNGDLKRYIEFKLKRAALDIGTIITDDAIQALSERLRSETGRGRYISTAYPLTVNLRMVEAMNLAVELGEAKITPEVIGQL